MAKTPDWESIEAAYRAGSPSIRTIAEQYGVSDGAIRKRAKRYNWSRDLGNKIKTATKDRLVRSTQSDSARVPLSDEQIIETEADARVKLVLGHRQDIQHWRGVTNKLLAGLEEYEVRDENVNEFARSINSGVDALGKCIKYERQAFGLDDDDKADEPAERSLTDDELEARIAELSKKVSSE